MYCEFPYNPVLKSMNYINEQMTLIFKKEKTLQTRVYAQVPKEIAYGLFYKKTASEVIKFFSSEVKGKFRVIEVK